MATYYLVGSGDWTTGAIWATTSGGTGAVVALTSADDVILDSAAGSVSITVPNGTFTCRSITRLAGSLCNISGAGAGTLLYVGSNGYVSDSSLGSNTLFSGSGLVLCLQSNTYLSSASGNLYTSVIETRITSDVAYPSTGVYLASNVKVAYLTMATGNCTLDLNSFTLTTFKFSASGANPTIISGASGKIQLDIVAADSGCTTTSTNGFTANCDKSPEFVVNIVTTTVQPLLYGCVNTVTALNRAPSLFLKSGTPSPTLFFALRSRWSKIDFTGSSTGTIRLTAQASCIGDFILPSNITIDASSLALTFGGSTDGAYNYPGTMATSTVLNKTAGAKLTLAGNWLGSNSTANAFTLQGGVLDLNGFAMQTPRMLVQTATAKVVTSPSPGTIHVTGASISLNMTGSSITFTNVKIKLSPVTGSPAMSVSHGCTSVTGLSLELGPTPSSTMSYTGAVGNDVDTLSILDNEVTFTGTLALTGSLSASPGAVLKSVTLGTLWNVTKASGTVALSGVSLQDSAASGGATFTAINSQDLGNNTGWTITPPVSSGVLSIGGGIF